MTDSIPLDGPLVLDLPDGTQVEVRPGPYGKGVSVVPVMPAGTRKPVRREGTGKRGRKPNEVTIQLRKKLSNDFAKEKMRDASAYVEWVMARDDTLSLTNARQLVYRERRQVQYVT